jgi:hypothetical protein
VRSLVLKTTWTRRNESDCGMTTVIGPKARVIPAWANAPGWDGGAPLARKRGGRRASDVKPVRRASGFLRAKGPFYSSLGQRPRKRDQARIRSANGALHWIEGKQAAHDSWSCRREDEAGFQPSFYRRLNSWGVAPGWDGGAPLARKTGKRCKTRKACIGIPAGQRPILSQPGATPQERWAKKQG